MKRVIKNYSLRSILLFANTDVSNIPKKCNLKKERHLCCQFNSHEDSVSTLHPLIHAGQASPVWRQSPVCCLPQKKAKISSSLFCRLLHRVWCTSCRARASFMRYACMYPARLFLLETPIDICSAEDRASEDEAVT
jgi:hypothetical protein